MGLPAVLKELLPYVVPFGLGAALGGGGGSGKMSKQQKEYINTQTALAQLMLELTRNRAQMTGPNLMRKKGKDVLVHRLPFAFSIATSMDVRMLPYLDRILVELDAGSIAMLEKGISAEITILDKDGNPVTKHSVDKLESVKQTIEIDAKGVATGTYTAVALLSAKGTPMPEMKKEFEINLVESKENKAKDFIQIHLKVKPNSTYKNDYISIDFWIDKTVYLPCKIIAVSTEPSGSLEKDISQINFLKQKVNKKLDKKVFDFKIPKGFDKPEIIPLKRETEQNRRGENGKGNSHILFEKR